MDYSKTGVWTLGYSFGELLYHGLLLQRRSEIKQKTRRVLYREHLETCVKKKETITIRSYKNVKKKRMKKTIENDKKRTEEYKNTVLVEW